MAWDATKPTSATNILDIPSIFTSNYAEMENILGVEHSTMTTATSGRHIPGATGWLSATTTSGITAISSPLTGALTLDTTIGTLKRYDARSGWTQMNLDPITRVLAYRNADYTMAVGASATIPFDTETIDTLSEFSTDIYKNGALIATGTYTFQASATGYYMVHANINVTPAANKEINLRLVHTNSASAQKYQSTIARTAPSTDEMSIRGTWIVDTAANDRIYLVIYHSHTATLVLEGGSDKSYLKIHRIS
jgi:hypothetical protein